MSPSFVPRPVVYTSGALVALWATSLGLSYVSLGAAALPVALTIALAKAVLVALVFMELLRESLSMKLAIVSAGVLALALVGFMVTDVLSR